MMTAEQLGAVLELAAAGLCAPEIARRTGCTADAVGKACRRRDVALAHGSPAGDLAWTPAEDERLQTLALAGFRGWDLARRMGRTKAQVQWRRQVLRRAGRWIEP